MKRFPCALLVGAAALVGCDEAAASSIDLGSPRALVYVTSEGGSLDGVPRSGGQVHVFERETLEPVGSFAVGNGASEVHATPDGSVVWVVSSGANELALLDTSTWALRRVPVGVRPVHSFLTPDRAEIWVGNDGSASISIISLATRRLVTTLTTGAGHHKMAFATDVHGNLVTGYVSNITDGTLTPVAPDHALRANVPGTAPAPHGMDYSSATTRVYSCTGGASPAIEIIATRDDPATPDDERDTVVGRIALPSRCSYLHVGEDGEVAYATVPELALFLRVDLREGTYDSFPTDAGPDKLEVVGDVAYVSNARAASVTVVDLTGVTPPFAIPVGNAIEPGSNPTHAHRGLRRDGHHLFVPNEFDGTVSVVELGTHTVVTTWSGLGHPTAVAVAGPGSGTTYPR